MSGFHRAFATGVACQQGTLTLPDTWFRPPLWDLLVLQLLRPDSAILPCLNSTFHLEYPLVLSRFCFSDHPIDFSDNTVHETDGQRRYHSTPTGHPYCPDLHLFHCWSVKVHFTLRTVPRIPRVTTLPPNVTYQRVTDPSADRARRCLTSERNRASQQHY